ncbi:MAG: cupin domain-containing protein [Iphinoe sp. HA4291-MV1]|jgi:mannose-6-phosphate isomerase-like protein (cupin superfamily)|nr:cupin domain-containing protein [Iphinoe sp. HA4291-MV1]
MAVKPIPDTVMESHDVGAVLRTLPRLDINEQTTPEEAGAAMHVLTPFNQCAVGVVGFSGQTPWERHPDDELLHILEGEVEVMIITENQVYKVTLGTGSVFVVPRTLWHKQFAFKSVRLLFVTSQEGNEESTAEDPRTK